MDALRQRIERWTLGPVFPPLAALLFFVLAGGAAIFGADIASHTRAFLAYATDLQSARPSIWVIAFWLALGCLASVAYLRYRADGYRDSERMRKMLQAVHRSPDPNVFGDYPHLFREAEARVSDLSAAAAEPTGARREASLAAVRGVLSHIIDLTRYFAPTPKATLRASIMLIEEPDGDGDEPYPETLTERLRFFDRTRHRLDSLRGLLFLPSDLAVGRTPPAWDGAPLLVLPVPRRADTAAGHRLALPGAPSAFLTGRQFVYEDTRQIADEWCGDLEKAVQDEIGGFYGRGGEGSHTRSFVSVRLGGETDPVGVLNIESADTHVLGHEPEYYVTFFSLVSPLLHLLTGPVATFAATSRDLGRLYGPRVGANAASGAAEEAA